jgi:CheY-like chemotaxis protein
MTEIIVVDDDPLVGQLSHDLLTDAGYDVELIRDSNLAMDAIQKAKPKFVLLDILMPGVDGLTLLHQIKNDEQLKNTRVGVVSGKSFSAERDRAKEYGAEMFVEKPYDVKTFAEQIRALVGEPGNAEAARAQGAAEAAMLEGAAPAAPGVDPTVRLRAFGEKPWSFILETKGLVIVLDAGAGAIEAGEALIQEGKTDAWLFLSGHGSAETANLGRFPLLRHEGAVLRVAGPREPGKSLADLLREQIKSSFVIDQQPVTAKLSLHELKEDIYELAAGVRVSPFYANHPGTTLGFVFDAAGRRAVYSPNAEIYGEAASALQDYDEKIGRLVRGSDLLVHEARFTDEDYEANRNQGHSALSNVVGFAADNEIGRLVLCGFDPGYDAAKIEGMEKLAAELLDEKGAVINCQAAKNGLLVEL